MSRDEARSGVRGFVALERSARSYLLGITSHVLDGDLVDAWNLGGGCSKDFSCAGLGAAAAAWRGVIAKESGDLALALQQFQRGTTSDIGPISRSCLWSLLLTAVEIGDRNLVERTIARLAEHDQSAVAASGSCLIATVGRRTPRERFHFLLAHVEQHCQDRLPYTLASENL